MLVSLADGPPSVQSLAPQAPSLVIAERSSYFRAFDGGPGHHAAQSGRVPWIIRGSA
jgi:hypothetical protein